MNLTLIRCSTAFCVLLVNLTALGQLTADEGTSHLVTRHHLRVVLSPERSAMSGMDRIRIQGPLPTPFALNLAPHAEIRSVRLNGQRRSFDFAGGRLVIDTQDQSTFREQELVVDYACRFDDPAPVNPMNTDNPGYGVSGTISPRGTFLLSGAGWYPRIPNARASFDLFVEGPKGTVAVTSGKLVGIHHHAQRTTSHWQVDHPPEGLSLSAGAYKVDRKTENGLVAMTFLYESSRHLAPRYLAASLRYLKRYSDLFGPYPFDAFAVVENFFPTGYGFPGYTLLGSRVLQLPFIPETSLPHEIVHNWWGNGVLVDFASGNWCEGLASYTADYLNKERRGEAAGRDYRRQALRNFSELVSAEKDFPLDRFKSRISPTTKAVGYDKATMVFHMLRQTVGDESFWEALRAFYRQFKFQKASWQDLQDVFERQAGRSLDRFFDQWLTRTGAPVLQLSDVRIAAADQQGYRVTGRIVQEQTVYNAHLQVALETSGQRIVQTVQLTGPKTLFSFSSAHRPLTVLGDPDVHLFRRLAASEMPPTVNSLRGSDRVIVVVANHLDRKRAASAARKFMQAMGLHSVRFQSESDFSLSDDTASDILLIGLPDSMRQVRLFPQALGLAGSQIQLDGQTFHGDRDVLFCVARRPENADAIVSLLHPLSLDNLDPVLRKIPHYGRYSYLVFSGGINRIKGTWEADASPLKVHLAPVSPPSKGAPR